MDGQYITIGGATYKRMVDKRKKYKYPITDEKRLARKLYMRAYRSAKRKNEVALLLAAEPAVGKETSPPRYDTREEPDRPLPALQQPDSVRTSATDSQDGHCDTARWQQNICSLD